MTNDVFGTFVPPTPAEIAANINQFPLKEMRKRGWIRGDIKDTAAMQSELERFFASTPMPPIVNPSNPNPDIKP